MDIHVCIRSCMYVSVYAEYATKFSFVISDLKSLLSKDKIQIRLVGDIKFSVSDIS